MDQLTSTVRAARVQINLAGRRAPSGAAHLGSCPEFVSSCVTARGLRRISPCTWLRVDPRKHPSRVWPRCGCPLRIRASLEDL